MTVAWSASSAAAMFRLDYPSFVEHGYIPLLEAHPIELTQFLGELHRQGRLRTDFRAIDAGVGHHVPCHMKALGSAAGASLLSLIPGLRVFPIDVSCSGMAGTYGLKSDNYATSPVSGRPMLE